MANKVDKPKLQIVHENVIDSDIELDGEDVAEDEELDFEDMDDMDLIEDADQGYAEDEEGEEQEVDGEDEEEEAEDSDGAGDDDEEDIEPDDKEHVPTDDEDIHEFLNIPKPEQSVVKTGMTFKDLGLGKWLTKKLDSFGLSQPTPVQANCIPKILEGSDVLGCAKTGTGKTLAFALPILQNLAVDPYGIYALVLTPTRELASQIADQFILFGRQINLKICTIIGGMSQIKQANELIKKPHIVIATPGRLADHIRSDPDTIAKIFKRIKYFVLDEADQLLDGPYNNDLKDIFRAIPKERHTLLFSATITSALSQLHQVSIKKPYFFEDIDEVKTVEKLEQRYVLCPGSVKDAYLVYVVKNFYENRPSGSVLIFCQTCKECQALALMFKGLNFKVGSLHSMISQIERNNALSSFRSKKIRILLCTDVAARGLDIPHVDLVVNHNVPKEAKTYVHRVGRSARAGRFGSAITFITQYDINLIREVEKLIGKKLDKLTVNHKKVTKYVNDVLMLKREAEIKLEREKFGERREINKRKKMLMSGLPEEEVEAAMKAAKERKRKREQKADKNAAKKVKQ